MCTCTLNNKGGVWLLGSTVLHKCHWSVTGHTVLKNFPWWEKFSLSLQTRGVIAFTNHCKIKIIKKEAAQEGLELKRAQDKFGFLRGHFLSLQYCCEDFSYCANIWRGAIMCIQNLSHLNSVGNNSRKFWVSALSSVYVGKSQEFISVVRGFCYLITFFCQSRKNIITPLE